MILYIFLSLCVISGRLEQEVALRHGQNLGRLAGQQFTVGPHLVGLRMHLDHAGWRRSGPWTSWRCRRARVLHGQNQTVETGLALTPLS
jgi:hypothetical protein